MSIAGRATETKVILIENHILIENIFDRQELLNRKNLKAGKVAGFIVYLHT